MRFLITTVHNFTFKKEEVKELRKKVKKITLITNKNVNSGEYYIFVNIPTIEELNTFVEDCGYWIVYGDKCQVNGIYYPVIGIYDDYREV